MGQLQRLIRAALLAGTLSGTLLFVYQYFVMVPRIVAAEAFETGTEGAAREADPHEREWKPQSGLERSLFTAAGTILLGIGCAALLLATVTLGGFSLAARHGPLWGLAGFACFVVAPALGLPPQPPGVAVADVGARQLWWAFTVAATTVGLLLVVGTHRKWIYRAVGGVVLLLPHALGAPEAHEPQAVPAGLVRDFAVASLLGSGLFWLALGTILALIFPKERPS